MFHIAAHCDNLPLVGKVAKGDQYAAALQADQIVATAHATAEEIRQAAEQEYTQQKQQGYEEGTKRAQAEAAERMLEAVAETNRYFTTVEQRTIEVVQRALHKILGELDENDLIQRSVCHALAWARTQSRVTLRVAPGQAANLQRAVEDLQQNYPVIDVLDIQADDRLQARDCVLETEIGSVDASIDVQLAAIEAALQRALRDARPSKKTCLNPAEGANDCDISGNPEPSPSERTTQDDCV